MEKPQLINFIAKVMEDSGFKVYKNFKTSQRVIDIYAVLPTTIGDFGVVIACKNYDKDFEVGVDVLKDMEDAASSLNASKVTVVSSSYFSKQATNYALRKNIKLVDRNNLVELAKKYQDNNAQTTLDNDESSAYIEDEYPEYSYDASDMEYLMHSRAESPFAYKNTLYKQEDRRPSLSSFLNIGNSYQSHGSSNFNLFPPIVMSLLNNTLVLILLVVAFSYIIAVLCGSLLNMDVGFTGLVEMVVAILLSYGFSFITERDSFFIIKGTFVFFIALIILIILIFV